MKERSPVSITSGFRIWADKTAPQPYKVSETAEPVPYNFVDFGVTEIVPPVVEEQDDAECLEDCEGADSLMNDTLFGIDMMYVIIAAVLLVIILVLIIVCCCCFSQSKV